LIGGVAVGAVGAAGVIAAAAAAASGRGVKAEIADGVDTGLGVGGATAGGAYICAEPSAIVGAGGADTVDAGNAFIAAVAADASDGAAAGPDAALAR
jgi:hypothetical protein